MDINRYQYFMLGVLVLLLGIQFRVVDSYVLNEKATNFLVERGATAPQRTLFFAAQTIGAGRKVIQPPDWIGWLLMSTGVVFTMHSVVMPRGTY